MVFRSGPEHKNGVFRSCPGPKSGAYKWSRPKKGIFRIGAAKAEKMGN